MLLITHSLPILAENCDKIAIMYAGKIMEYAPVRRTFPSPLHPYTSALLSALPSIRGSPNRLKSLPGAPPSLLNPPSGCRFHPRCPHTQDKCRRKEPELVEVEKNHFVACHLIE
jgi:peptide/nickel transport system ATP-binding protein